MANRNDDTWYFGKLFDQAADDARHEQWLHRNPWYAKNGIKVARTKLKDYSYIEEREEILSALEFKPNDVAFVCGIGFFGPVVRVDTFGKWGSTCSFTDESWAKLQSGVIVYDWFDAFSAWGRRITIAGEVVLDEQVGEDIMYGDESWKGFTQFEGRTGVHGASNQRFGLGNLH